MVERKMVTSILSGFFKAYNSNKKIVTLHASKSEFRVRLFFLLG